jgi:hypothetical protein
MGMGFITIAPEDGFPRTTGFLHGRLAGYFVSPRIDTSFSMKKFRWPGITSPRFYQAPSARLNPSFTAVVSSTRNPVYAKQKLSPSSLRGRFSPCLLLTFLFTCLPISSRADPLEDAVHNLAHKVCTRSRQQSVRINWQESPQFPGSLTESLKKAFLAQLSACGIASTKNTSSPEMNVTMRWTTSMLLVIAGPVDSFDGLQIRMVEIPRAALSISNDTSLASHLRKEILWQQENPINSAAEWYDRFTQEHFLFLLSQGLLVRLRFENGDWTAVDSTEVPMTGRRSRLGRGSFSYGYPQGQLGVLSDGKFCEMQIGSHILFVCRDTDGGGKVVTISSACDETRQILSAGRGDYTQRDRITLAGPEVTRPPLSEDEIRSGSVDVPGPVLDINTVEDGKIVTAVVRNLSTGNYEVYRITTVCGD